MKRIFSLFASALLAISAWAQNTHNGHEYVDLGLTSRTLWATCNVGAETPDQYGDYFAWGETTTKETYDWETYFDTSDDGITFDKYYIGGQTMLSLADDAANKIMGERWVTPSHAQQLELIQECYWVWGKLNDVEGFYIYKVKDVSDKGKTVYKGEFDENGYTTDDTHIFIPAIGYEEDNPDNQGCQYWSRNLSDTYSDNAWRMYLGGRTTGTGQGLGRYHGFQIRAVFVKEHEYVDLGLTSRTLWATCNVGAETPDQYGAYYAWGEIATYYSAGGNTKKPTWKEGYSDGYNWSSYKYMDHSKDSWEGCTKYTIADGQMSGVWYDSEGNFIGDGLTELEDADDVAVQTWGGSWEMPTYEQQTELRKECYWVWTSTYKGKSVNGYIVYKAKKDEDKGVKVYDGNTPSSDYDVATDAHIFLPAAGYCWNTDLIGMGEGSYWSRSLNTYGSDVARYLSFNSDIVDCCSIYRNSGFSVRPVYKAPIAEITTDEGTKVYTDVEEFKLGFSEIEGEATVKLLGDIILQDVDVDNDNKDANITLDLNGHSITDNNDDGIIIAISEGALTITGEGTIENTAEYGVTILSAGTLTVKGGTYKSALAACAVAKGAELIIDGGQFDSEALYYTSEYHTKPIVKGGIFSMNPSDCVAEGYVAVPNDDEDTKADYPYKVVEKSLTPTAIDAVNAEKSGKAIKTIENGHVVIIRDNKKFDLSGREL